MFSIDVFMPLILLKYTSVSTVKVKLSILICSDDPTKKLSNNITYLNLLMNVSIKLMQANSTRAANTAAKHRMM